MATKTLKWHGPTIADACVAAGPDNVLLVLDREGGIHQVDVETGTTRRLCSIPLPPLDLSNANSYFGASRHHLHTSADARYGAVVADFDKPGLLFDMTTGRVIANLDGGDYCEGTVPFSAAFVQRSDRHVLIHRTAWNRLDATDAATGELLTARTFEEALDENGKTKQAHDLDYFHGGLLPNPPGTLLYDDGWVWHPVAVPRVFAIDAWLDGNVWESEDGASVRRLTMRDDWNVAACWVDDRHIALAGLANWDVEAFEERNQATGIRIVDAYTESRDNDRLIAMPHEVIRMFAHGDLLHAVSAHGTSSWNLATGECTSEFPDFCADLFIPAYHRFVRVLPDELQFCSY